MAGHFESLGPLDERWRKGMATPGGVIPLSEGEMVPEFVGTAADFRGFGEVNPPRAPHPVFGPVPRGFLVLEFYRNIPADDMTGPFDCLLVAPDQIAAIRPIAFNGPVPETGPDCRVVLKFIGGDGGYTKQRAAEVSRLIAEAQGDG